METTISVQVALVAKDVGARLCLEWDMSGTRGGELTDRGGSRGRGERGTAGVCSQGTGIGRADCWGRNGTYLGVGKGRSWVGTHFDLHQQC
jgi:hypothetical protein